MGNVARFALSIGAATLFAGCSGAYAPIGAPGATAQSRAVATHTERDALTSYEKVFSYRGKIQTFVVPSGVTQIKVDARGAQGGGSYGGFGGHVVAVIAVTPGQKLRVLVGGQASATSGGFNGGGSGGTPSCYIDYCGYGGGGASDVRKGKKLRDRIMIAGGGGGQGGRGYPSYVGGTGGAGGSDKGATGGVGFPYGGAGGSGGTQHHGGAGAPESYGSTGNGAPGSPGALGDGGAGGQGCVPIGSRCGDSGANGGGGGGGYYGGGGGAAGPGTIYGSAGGGGGGGSSYIERGAKTLIDSRGWKKATGNGLVVFRWR